MRLKNHLSINKAKKTNITTQLIACLALLLFLSNYALGQESSICSGIIGATIIQTEGNVTFGGGTLTSGTLTNYSNIVAEDPVSSITINKAGSVTPFNWNTNKSTVGYNQNNYSTTTDDSSFSIAANTIPSDNQQVIDNDWHTRIVAGASSTTTSVADYYIGGQNTKVITSDGVIETQSQIPSSADYVVTNTQLIDTNNVFTVNNLNYDSNSILIIQDGGQLNVSSNYTSADTGTLDIVIDPTNSNRVTPVVVGNSAVLNGTLQIIFPDGTTQASISGDVLTIMTASNFSGNFSTITSNILGISLSGFIQTNSTGNVSYFITVEDISE